MKTALNKVLIYRLGSLGDTVIALPCFHIIKDVFPDADITLLTNKPVVAKAAPLEAVLGSEYFFNRVLAYPVGTRNLKLLLQLIKQIRALKIDTLVNLTAARSKKAAIRDKWFFRTAGIKNLIGFPTEEAHFEPVIDPLTGYYEWEADRLVSRLRLLKEISLADEHYWDLRLTVKEIKAADNAIAELTPGKRIIAVSAGTKMESKDWEEDNWVALVKSLNLYSSDYQLVVVGAPDEWERSERCLNVWNGKGVNLCGKTSPRVSAEILRRASVFIGHDSGPMHLAACVSTPCVAIFSGRNLPKQWYPRGKNNRVIHHLPECAGCKLEVCIIKQKECIRSISVNEVLNAVLDVLNIPVNINE